MAKFQIKTPPLKKVKRFDQKASKKSHRSKPLKAEPSNKSDVEARVTTTKRNDTKRSRPEKDFNRTNSLELVGRTAIFESEGEGDFFFASYLIRLRTDPERLRPHFLSHYLNANETRVCLKSIATRAVSQSNISATRLHGFVIPVPTASEQDQIIETIDCLDLELSLHRRKQAALASLFNTSLHELMTARLRVHDLNLTELNLNERQLLSEDRRN